MKTPSYRHLVSASRRASAAAKGASKKKDTKPELRLRRALWRAGHRYRKCVKGLPGKPDIVFLRVRLVVFCDGDFWHGRDWLARRAKLERGHNPTYWIAKIERNMARDRENDAALREAGWSVLRVWESEINSDVQRVVARIEEALQDGCADRT